MRGFRYAFLLACVPLCQAMAAQAVKICHEELPKGQAPLPDSDQRNQKRVRQAATAVGWELEFVALPWKRCLANVAEGSVAAAMDASYTAERAAYAQYPMTKAGTPDLKRRLRFNGYTFYRLKGSAVHWDGKDFYNLDGPVGVQLGYSIGGDLSKKGVSVFESSGGARNQMRALTNGNIAMVALLTEDGDALLRESAFSEKVEAIVPAYSRKPYFVIFNKRYYADNQKSVEQFWRVLEKVQGAR